MLAWPYPPDFSDSAEDLASNETPINANATAEQAPAFPATTRNELAQLAQRATRERDSGMLQPWRYWSSSMSHIAAAAPMSSQMASTLSKVH